MKSLERACKASSSSSRAVAGFWSFTEAMSSRRCSFKPHKVGFACIDPLAMASLKFIEVPAPGSRCQEGRASVVSLCGLSRSAQSGVYGKVRRRFPSDLSFAKAQRQVETVD